MMSLRLQILEAARAAKTAKSRYETESRLKAWERCTQAARKAHTDEAVGRYKQAMAGKGWMTQSEIENRLGMGSTVATKFLKRLLEELELVERRNKNDAPVHVKRQGYEWRWK